MIKESESTISRIKHIRKMKRRSLKDCAAILGISKKDYKDIEHGKGEITMPELELLAIFLEIDEGQLFNHNPVKFSRYAIIDEDLSSRYKQLRKKMIQAKLILEREAQCLLLEDVHKTTEIDLAVLQTYETGSSPVPFTHLQQICEALSISIEKFFYNELISDQQNQSGNVNHAWKPEFPKQNTDGFKSKEDPYYPLINTIKLMPKEAQAKFLKSLIDHFNKT